MVWSGCLIFNNSIIKKQRKRENGMPFSRFFAHVWGIVAFYGCVKSITNFFDFIVALRLIKIAQSQNAQKFGICAYCLEKNIFLW